MAKEFKTAEELIVILESKGLSFSQRQKAKRLLTENNYYCVTAYKTLFYKNGERTYRPNVDFEHLYAMYSFDKALKTAILKHLLFIEQKIKTAISNQISSQYGIRESDYLKRENYDQRSPFLDSNLRKIRRQSTVFGAKNGAVKHYKDTHGFVPFWVLSKCLTMGVIRDFFSILKPNDQDVIVRSLLEKEIAHKPVRQAKAMISFFADIRNMCAHDEKLSGYVHKRIRISPLPEHDALQCKKNAGGVFVQGCADLLALIISIKYFVNKTMYNEFIQDISSCINKCYKSIKDCVTKAEFLDYIGLSENYEELRKIPIGKLKDSSV